MKITKEYLLSRGFKMRGGVDSDHYFRLQFVHDINNICPNSLTGSFDDQGFELYGYGYVKDQKHMSNILDAISFLAAKPLHEIIK